MIKLLAFDTLFDLEVLFWLLLLFALYNKCYYDLQLYNS